MLLTGYFDESGTHRGSELSLMAGFVGDKRQWQKFEKRTGKLFDRFGVDIFHSIDVKRSDKDFVGWKIARKIEFLDEFQHIANETLEIGMASVLRADDYAYYRGLEWPKGTSPDSMYGILFRASLSATIDAVLITKRWAENAEPKLKVVLESGHRNAPDARRLSELFNDRFAASHALSGLSFEDKSRSRRLAAADLFAYSAYREETGARPFGTPEKPLKSEKSYRGNLWRIEIRRETLDALHEQAAEIARERARSKQARRAS